MLYLIGLGIWDEKDVSIRGIEVCKKADKVYAELYTAKWGGSLERLSQMIGKDILLLKRSDLEENVGRILQEAKVRDVAILVPGDPLAATTHHHIIMEARVSGIRTKIIHSSSIFTAVSVCGLSIYNFGRTVTVAKPQENYHPVSYYEEIAKNFSQGLHTLLLLDIDMDVCEALKILMDIDKEKGKNLFSPERKIIVASRLGSENEKILYARINRLLGESLPPPAVLILPGKLQFFEKEFLETL